jgi:hypothetical protein
LAARSSPIAKLARWVEGTEAIGEPRKKGKNFKLEQTSLRNIAKNQTSVLTTP